MQLPSSFNIPTLYTASVLPIYFDFFPCIPFRLFSMTLFLFHLSSSFFSSVIRSILPLSFPSSVILFFFRPSFHFQLSPSFPYFEFFPYSFFLFFFCSCSYSRSCSCAFSYCSSWSCSCSCSCACFSCSSCSSSSSSSVPSSSSSSLSSSSSSSSFGRSCLFCW